MPDRNDIIRSVETCFDYWLDQHRCLHPIELDDVRQMKSDAIALLKEQEAKTGTWIEKTDYMGDTYYDCSVCGESWTTIDGTPWQNGMNYCPHCGAKMGT